MLCQRAIGTVVQEMTRVVNHVVLQMLANYEEQTKNGSIFSIFSSFLYDISVYLRLL